MGHRAFRSYNGVPSLVHGTQLGVCVDLDLLRFGELWAAAKPGTTCFRLHQAIAYNQVARRSPTGSTANRTIDP